MSILIDGSTYPNDDECDLSTGDEGAYPPFYLFDTGLQEHISGPLPDRNIAERLVSITQRLAAPDRFPGFFD